MKDRVPLLRPSPKDGEELGFLPARMAELGYTEQGVRECIRVLDVCLINWSEIPGYHWRCREEDSGRADMVTLWLLGQGGAPDRLEKWFGAEGLKALKRRGLLAEREGRLYAQVDLYPCEGAWVFTDRVLSPIRLPKHVYELGKDSYVLARVTPRDPVGSALDLCTGSGVHMINAARHARRVVGTDINSRAADFARVNLRMNGVEGEIGLGSLYEPIGSERFDLITANPPFHPTPDENMQKYRTGGESGEVLTEQVVRGLADHLNPGGLLSMVVVYPILRDETYLARLQRWLGGGAGWGVAQLNFIEMQREFFIQANMEVKGDWEAHVAEFDRWMRSYDRQGIDKIGVANIFIRRLREGAPGWTAYKAIPFPNRQQVAPVGPWLKALETYHDPAWKPTGTERLNPDIREIWLGRNGNGYVEFSDPDWPTQTALEPDEAAAARGDLSAAGADVLRRLGQKEVLAT